MISIQGRVFQYTFRNYFPVRGWKPYSENRIFKPACFFFPKLFPRKGMETLSHSSSPLPTPVSFPKLFPRKGMETLCCIRSYRNFSFRNYFPVRGWKPFAELESESRLSAAGFPKLFPRKGMETSLPASCCKGLFELLLSETISP